MEYAQLTRRHGLRDVAACINSQRSKQYRCGLRHPISRSTLADANERRDWHLFEQLAQRMVSSALALYAHARIDNVLVQPLYAMDSTVVDFCLKLFPWPHYRSTKAAIQAHTVLDLNGAIPVMMTITAGNVADVKLLDALQLPAYSLVVLDRGYIDYAQLYALTQHRIDLSALAIAQIYRQRWQIELFFKWLKQNLNIQHFFGNSENAVKSQVWIAICVYLAAVMTHKTLQISVSLHTLLQILEVNLLEKTSIADLASLAIEPMPDHAVSTQRCLF